MAATQSQSTPEAVAFYNAATNMMATLAIRWLDEGKYEDVAGYAKPLEPIAARCGVKITGMLKRPFGCTFSVGDREFRLTISARGSYEYKRTK